MECALRLWSQAWPQNKDILVEAGTACHLQQHLLPRPSPGQTQEGLMGSPGLAASMSLGFLTLYAACTRGPQIPLLLGSFLNPHWSLGPLAPGGASSQASARACPLLKQHDWGHRSPS